jgi:hypothetical protein
MTFFLDNMISPHFARALRQVNKEVLALRERFAEDTADEVWLSELAHSASVLLTVDRHIRTRPLERRELRKSGIIALFLGPFFSKLRFWQQFVWLVRNWEKLEQTIAGLARGSCMLVRQNGKMLALPND